MDDQQRQEKQQELDQLQRRVAELQQELASEPTERWRPKKYYTAYYATAGFMLGMIAAVASLLFNVIGSAIVGQHPLELIRVYLTFPLQDKALAMDSGMAIAIGCCLYIGTGMLLGIPFHLVLTKLTGGDPHASLSKRLGIATVFGLLVWVVNFYGILAWLQPLLFGGNWIVEMIPIPVAAMTHLIFGWTMALVYPWGLYRPYELQTSQ